MWGTCVGYMGGGVHVGGEVHMGYIWPRRIPPYWFLVWLLGL